MKTQKLIDSFNAAIEGFLYVVKTQRSMRIHFLLGLLVILLGIYLNFTRIEFMILCFTVSMVLITEMVNTALEVMLDHVSASHSRWVRTVKDISAGAVLVASVNAVVVAYFLFVRDVFFEQEFQKRILRISQSNWHISFFILITIIGIVIIGKTLFHKGRPLRGGMPSGHSAIAFSIWTLVAFFSQSALLVFSVFILAFMIAQSRVGRHYHTAWEVFAGAAIGVVFTVMIYRLLMG